MRFGIVAAILSMFFAFPTIAQTATSPISGISFLTGEWAGGGKSEGETIDTGTSSIQRVLGGNALLRRDHTDVSDKTGKVIESFDQVMLIYPEGGTLHADYLDGTHVIHYTSATVQPGQSVQFLSAASPVAPVFRLTYTKMGDTMLGIKFEMQPPGAPAFQTIAEGSATRK